MSHVAWKWSACPQKIQTRPLSESSSLSKHLMSTTTLAGPRPKLRSHSCRAETRFHRVLSSPERDESLSVSSDSARLLHLHNFDRRWKTHWPQKANSFSCYVIVPQQVHRFAAPQQRLFL